MTTAAASRAAGASDSMIDQMVEAENAFVAGIKARIDGLANAGQDYAALLANLEKQGLSLTSLVAASALVSIVVVGVFMLLCKLRRIRPDALGSMAAAAVASAAAGAIVAWTLAGSDGMYRRSLMTAVILTTCALLAWPIGRWVIIGSDTKLRLRLRAQLSRFLMLVVVAVIWALAGSMVTTTIRHWQGASGLRDLVGTFFLSIPTFSVIVLAYCLHGRGLSLRLAGPRPRGRFQAQFARRWPRLAALLAVACFLLIQISLTVGSPVPPSAFLITLILALLAPHLDARIARWAASGLNESGLSVAAVAARRTARPALLTVCLTAIATVWASPVAAVTGFTMVNLSWPAAQSAAILLGAAYAWNLMGVATDRLMADEEQDRPASASEESTTPRSRVGTLLPIVVASFKVALLALAGLTVLLAMGVNVWPFVTGLSVFGLAIGFGSQTLVKDVVSGLFFLIDDAFRLGEYVETSGAKGTVEKISLRSLSLRHPRGALATVPYGQIGKIQNYSRDWVIEKIVFRVAFDTDVDRVRKIFKQIGQEIMDDPEIAKDILEPFKSQGISEVEDGTLLIRGKFKAVAGQQFTARKAILAAVQRTFREEGIKVVAKPLGAVA